MIALGTISSRDSRSTRERCRLIPESLRDAQFGCITHSAHKQNFIPSSGNITDDLKVGVYVTSAPVNSSREICSVKTPLIPNSGDRAADTRASVSL